MDGYRLGEMLLPDSVPSQCQEDKVVIPVEAVMNLVQDPGPRAYDIGFLPAGPVTPQGGQHVWCPSGTGPGFLP